jgi:hypothetical protein
MDASAHATASLRPLTGWVLWLARIVWLALVALQLASFISLLPEYLPLADHPCSHDCLLTTQAAHVLADAGIAPRIYVAAMLVVTVLSVLVSVIVAGLLFARRSFDLMALLAAYDVVILPTSLLLNSAPFEKAATQATAFLLPPTLDLAIGAVQSASTYGIFLLFPTGRFVPRWSWALLVGFLAFSTVIYQWPTLFDGLIAGWPFFFGSAIACMGYRYRRVSTPRERQQTKWVLFGFLIFLLTSQAYWLPTFSPVKETVYAPLAYLVYQFLLPVVPVTFFIAIQRYRLYEIDTILRRTLVYGILTAILAGVYLIGVVGTQALVQGFGGDTVGDSPVLIVMTTLVIAALFRPLRRALQWRIDRRFYRRKYDAARSLATFGMALRSDVDIDHLRDHLLRVARDAMQPAHISLWLRQEADSPHAG